jgi:hypothetical protein
MNKFRIITLSVLCFIVMPPFSASAQYGDPVAILEYFDDELEIELTDASGEKIYDIYFGMELDIGDIIKTNDTSAELWLDPNGTIIKLSTETIFTIENLQKSDDESNIFTLVLGKIHAIAASTDSKESYQITTQSAVCSVRGTEFGVISIPGSEEQAYVIDGTVSYTKKSTNRTISLSAGMYGDLRAAEFGPKTATQNQLDGFKKNGEFQRLDRTRVPGPGSEGGGQRGVNAGQGQSSARDGRSQSESSGGNRSQDGSSGGNRSQDDSSEDDRSRDKR